MDPFPKDHLPFNDDFSVGNFVYQKAAKATSKRPGSEMDQDWDFYEQKRKRMDDTARKGPPRKRVRTGGTVTRSLFTNDAVATGSVAALAAGAAAYTAGGIAMDRLNSRIAQGIEEGFARHTAIQNSGAYSYDALTESRMAGRYLDSMVEGMERMLPMMEDLLPLLL